MGFLDIFKKKDNYDSMLKDPLTDPLGGMPTSLSNGPNDFNGMNNNSGFPKNELPGFENNNLGLKDESALGGFNSNDTTSQLGMNNNFGTSASVVNTNNSNYANSPPMFRPQNPQNRFNPNGKEAEVYEEMQTSSKQMSKNNEVYPLDKRDMELINSKLDNIKTQLENLNHRLDNIERGNNDAQTQRRRYAW